MASINIERLMDIHSDLGCIEYWQLPMQQGSFLHNTNVVQRKSIILYNLLLHELPEKN